MYSAKEAAKDQLFVLATRFRHGDMPLQYVLVVQAHPLALRLLTYYMMYRKHVAPSLFLPSSH